MKKYTLAFCLFISVFLTGCTTTFFGTALIITFRDLISYVVIALVIAFLIAVTAKTGKGREMFWVGFLLSLLLTPLAGLIFLLIKITRKTE